MSETSELNEKAEQMLAVVGLTAFKHESQREVLQDAFDELRAAITNAKAAALNQPAASVGLTEEERELLEDIAENDTYISDFAISQLRKLLTRDAAAKADGLVSVRREVLQLLVRQAKVEVVASYYTPTPYNEDEIRSASNFAIAEAEAALAKGGEQREV